MLLALRAATGNVQASDIFMQVLEERAAQRLAREEQRDAQHEQESRAREAQLEQADREREARMDKFDQDYLNFIREIKTFRRRITFLGLFILLIMLTNLIVSLAQIF